MSELTDLLRRKGAEATESKPVVETPVHCLATILASLRGRGFTVRIREDGLLGVTPAELLTDADRSALKEHRQALLDLLWGDVTSPYLNNPLGWPPDRPELYRGLCVPWTQEDLDWLTEHGAVK